MGVKELKIAHKIQYSVVRLQLNKYFFQYKLLWKYQNTNVVIPWYMSNQLMSFHLYKMHKLPVIPVSQFAS